MSGRGRIQALINNRWRGPTVKASPEVQLEVYIEDHRYRRRYQCSVCGDLQEWFRLEPGTGRCVKCQP